MGRKLRDSSLENRTGRGHLKARGKPYYRLMQEGLHIGYRKPKSGAGKWVVRHYDSDAGKYKVETLTGVADDFADADGLTILNFGQAQAKARECALVEGGAADITVAQAVEKYVAERDKRDSKRLGRPVKSDANQRLRRYVLGRKASGKREAIRPASLAAIELHALDDSDLAKWRNGLNGDLSATAKQRLINDLKAALNSAYHENRKRLPSTLPITIKFGLKAEAIDDDDDASGVPENQILTDAQVSRLIRAAQEIDAEQKWEGDLFRMVVVLAATGTRYSQAARMRVRDCQLDNGRLLIPTSRKGKGAKVSHTPVPVGRDVLNTLRPVVIGRSGDGILLEAWGCRQEEGVGWTRDKRGPWQKSEINRPWDDIRERARMPEVKPYAFRHTSIVRGIKKNLPIRLVAALHDTSVKMIERHYSRWIADGLEDLAAKAVVPLVPKSLAGSNVVSITASA